MLLCAFGRQARNTGIHSRFIDGTVLEPGFELDELMAPILALERYVSATGDGSVLNLPCITEGIARILRTLKTRRHPTEPLYETFLMPTDDVRTYPYLTYDNVLVWRALRALSPSLPAQYGSLAGEGRQSAGGRIALLHIGRRRGALLRLEHRTSRDTATYTTSRPARCCSCLISASVPLAIPYMPTPRA